MPVSTLRGDVHEESKTNTTIREVFDESVAEHGGEAFDICILRKPKAAKFCFKCLTFFCEIQLEPHHRGLKRHTLLDPEVKLDNRICKKHNVCRTDKECVCQFCISEDHTAHNIVPLEAECDEIKILLRETELEVRQMIQEKLQRVQEVKYLVELSERDTQKDTSDCAQVFTALIASIERSQSELIWEIKRSREQLRGWPRASLKLLSKTLVHYSADAQSWSSSYTQTTLSVSSRDHRRCPTLHT